MRADVRERAILRARESQHDHLLLTKDECGEGLYQRAAAIEPHDDPWTGDVHRICRWRDRHVIAAPACIHELERRAFRTEAVSLFDGGAFDVDAFASPYTTPATASQVALGRALFFEPQLSGDGAVACATCHDPDRAFTDGRERSVARSGKASLRTDAGTLRAPTDYLRIRVHFPHRQTSVTHPFLHRVCVAALATASPWASGSAQTDTLATATPQMAASASPRMERMEASFARRLPALAIAAISSATMTQALGTPTRWPRTWGGFGRRVGDQAGFTAIEESVRLTLGATVNWMPDTLPCRGRLTARGTVRLRAVLPRLGCAARETVLLRTPEGRPRPNFPLAVGVVGAAAASTLWRPDADTPAHAVTLAVTRTAIVFSATVISHLISDWRQDRKQ